MRYKITFILTVVFLAFGLAACDSDEDLSEGKLKGRYVCAFDETVFDFSEDGTFTTNEGLGENEDCFSGTYEFEDDELRLCYAENSYFIAGYIYKSYICTIYNGELPLKYMDTTISREIENINSYKYTFKEDKTYEEVVTSSGEIVYTKTGTYSIKGDTVTCTSDDNKITTFINADKIYCIDYIKE